MKEIQIQTSQLRLSLLTCGAIFGLCLVLFVLSAYLFLNQSQDMETEMIMRDIDRSMSVFEANSLRLLSFLGSYSVWDESYTHIDTHKQSYVDDNYNVATFINGKFDLVIMLAMDGQVIFERAFDANRKVIIPIPEGLRAYYKVGSPLLNIDNPQDFLKGLIMLPDGPLYLVVRPVVTGKSEGPVKSVLIFGRFLDQKAMEEWSKTAHLTLSAEPFSAKDLPSDYQAVKVRLTATPSASNIQVIDENRIAGYSLYYDLVGQPCLIVRLLEPREIYQQSLSGLKFLGWSLILIGLVVSGGAVLLIDRLVRSQRASEKLTTRLKAIGNLAHTLSVSPGIEVLSAHLLTALQEVTHCYNINIFQVRESEIELLAGKGGYTSGHPPLGFRMDLNKGIIGYAAATGRYMLVPDVSQSSLFEYWEGLPFTRSELALPVLSGGQVIAVLDLQSDRLATFDETDIEALQVLANQLSVALDNARLYDEARQRATELERLYHVSENRLHQVEALHTIDMALTGNLDLASILQIFLDKVMVQLKVDAASVLLYKPDTQMLEYAANRGFRTEALQHTHLLLGEGVAGRAGLQQKMVRVADLRVQADDLNQSPLLIHEGFVTYLGVPLLVKGQLKGILELFQRAFFQPDSDWLQFLQSFANQAAIAIEDATLVEGLERANIDLTAAYEATIEGWARALELRDGETEGHSRRVTDLAVRLGRAMQIPADELVHLRRGALLHDIGKMAVSDEVLLKPGKLNETEWEQMRKHPEFSYKMLSSITFLHQALDIPYCHHERWDGTGYPRGLQGEQIPLAARLFAVVDVWDAVTHNRRYQTAWSHARATEYLQEQAGKHFDAEVVCVFLSQVVMEDF